MTFSYLIAARRSPIAPRGGALAHFLPHALAAPVLAAALADAGISADQVGELIVSNALGAGGNIARLVALGAGWPQRIAGLSIDRQCAGGLDALILADALIRSGQHDIVVAGGVESYSRRPLRAHSFADGRPPEPYEQARFTPWPERDPDMALAADQLGQDLGISRSAQDDWAMASHAKARPTPEIVPVAGLDHDPFTRDLTPRHCARAPVVNGTITAANMAVAADGAGFVVMASAAWVAAHGIDAVGFAGGVTLGGDPLRPGLAPVAAIDAVLARAGLRADDLAAAEIMEAFAVQAIACQQGANIAPDIINTLGGALARGHPVGASGAVLAVRLFHELRIKGGTGLAAIAAAGGIGSAILLDQNRENL